jgi:hypothetical protein
LYDGQWPKWPILDGMPVADSADFRGGVGRCDRSWLEVTGDFSPFSPQFRARAVAGVADSADFRTMADTNVRPTGVADSADFHRAGGEECLPNW